MSDFDNMHNPDWDSVRESGLNYSREFLNNSFSKSNEESEVVIRRRCAKCGRKEFDEVWGNVGYGPQNNLCTECWHLPDIDDWIEQHK